MNKIKVCSKIPTGVMLELYSHGLEYCNITNMCIKEAGSMQYNIPENIRPGVFKAIEAVYALDPELYGIPYNCYLTLKHEYVNPGSTGTRPGWHIDGFMSDQKNFIWSDCLPTQVVLGEFDLTLNHDISLTEMEQQSEGKLLANLKPNVLYSLDQEAVHAPVINNTGAPILRTFLKLTYTQDKFNCTKNAWNYMLPHIRGTELPGVTRNHGVL